nr:DUF3152 domain-containing protein [Saccharopolyspora sp. HNM0983]
MRASWNPTEPGPDEDAERRGGRHRRISRYGWRVYAIPLLVVVTALAVLQTVGPVTDGEESGEQAAAPADRPAPEPKRPVVTEAQPGGEYDEDLFSADLPPGGPIPETGARTFEVQPGSTPAIGSGELYRYTVETEVGMDLPEGPESFSRLVQDTLSDPRSWTNPEAGGISLQRVDGDEQPDFRVILVSRQTAREACEYSDGVPFDSSCRKGEMVYLNAARWARGAVAFEGDLGNYRRYAINHEVGHVFGNGHVGCPEPGANAPVMMQQSFSVSNNELHELNQVADQGTSIPADGFECRPNAWPHPTGGGGH